ncbi:hypothetical protein STEG23_035473, partial [Scotinomys teguina]
TAEECFHHQFGDCIISTFFYLLRLLFGPSSPSYHQLLCPVTPGSSIYSGFCLDRRHHPITSSCAQSHPLKTEASQSVRPPVSVSQSFLNKPERVTSRTLEAGRDTKIASLERNIRDLEDEIQMLKANGVLNTEDREEEIKQIEVYKSHSKFMKTKIDQLKQELSKKESELLALQTKLETLSNQNSDCKQHIEVLKESLTAKEQRAAILQTEVDALRLRLEEKESFLNKKTKQLQDLTEEKGTLAGEIRDMKDMLEVKERKINVLQKK